LENSEFIPYGCQDITEEDVESVVSVLRSDFITQGNKVPDFERELCEYAEAKYSVVVNSCTAALHIACLALKLGEGDILWTSPISFVASANCAMYCGATVNFVDIDPDTALLSIEKLTEKLEWAKKNGKLPKVVVPVHFSGQPCEMKEIYLLGQQYGFKIIEDAAHAIGSTYYDKPVGNCQYSDITVFSFHPVKIITTGEGGAAMTNDSSLRDSMRLYRSHGIKKTKKEVKKTWLYDQSVLGYNYRMSDIHAALGLSQIQRLNHYVERRIAIAKMYSELLNEVDSIELLSQLKCRTSSHHLFIAKVDALKREEIFLKFRSLNIGVNVHYIPIHLQPYYRSIGFSKGDFPCAEEYYEKCISLPIYPNLSEQNIEKIARIIKIG